MYSIIMYSNLRVSSVISATVKTPIGKENGIKLCDFGKSKLKSKID